MFVQFIRCYNGIMKDSEMGRTYNTQMTENIRIYNLSRKKNMTGMDHSGHLGVDEKTILNGSQDVKREGVIFA